MFEKTKNGGRSRAFTLIELLVVVAIIAMLISILLPSLQQAREQARAVVCATTLKSAATSMNHYFNEYREAIPGANTSGAAVGAKQNDIDAFNDGTMPVQRFDWMTPLYNYGIPLPANRADRWRLLWTRYACPSQMRTSVWFGAADDEDDFDALNDNWPACSYLQSAAFSYWGSRHHGKTVGRIEGAVPGRDGVKALIGDFMSVDTRDYRGQLAQVGDASMKVFAADGTRYVPTSGLIDHDISIDAKQYGAFTSSGAWWGGSTAYGGAVQSETWVDGETVSYTGQRNTKGQNLGVSYRHGPRGATGARDNRGAINALFFDGHVARLGDRASRDIRLWYPKGSVVLRTADRMTYAEVDDVIP